MTSPTQPDRRISAIASQQRRFTMREHVAYTAIALAGLAHTASSPVGNSNHCC